MSAKKIKDWSNLPDVPVTLAIPARIFADAEHESAYGIIGSSVEEVLYWWLRDGCIYHLTRTRRL